MSPDHVSENGHIVTKRNYPDAPFAVHRKTPHCLPLRLNAKLRAQNVENLLFMLRFEFQPPLSIIIVHCENNVVVQAKDDLVIEVRTVTDLRQVFDDGASV